ncbi:GT4 family glycosyltransferase PelF [Ornithinibacillus salinisoli]|uniref:GT4 family glycosyltransferase PelF n=1 Tax=Ornithinibacillus salinisoli TaxID=1848459 RepID=A0ABW4VXJ3_9BACI
MKICIVAEGSYPYITGGVSSWIQTLITSMPEHEFIIYAIGAQEKDRGKFKYTLPSNLVEVREVFLDSYLPEKGIPGKSYKLNQSQKNVIKSLLTNQVSNWEDFLSLFYSRKVKIDSVANFMASKDIFDIIQELCVEQETEIPFTEMYWSVRSMLVPLLLVLTNPLVEADIYHSVSTGYAGVVGAFGKYRYDKPFVLTEHGIYTREREEEIIKADWIHGSFKDFWIQYFYSLSNCAYSYSDEVISLFTKNKEIQIEIGCEEERISIIPNGVDAMDYRHLPQKTKEDDAYINIGAIVRVVPIKDIKTMLHSYAIIKQQVPHAQFFIFGPYEEDLEYYEECLQLVHSLGIDDVYFTGSINIKEHIGRMDLLVLTSISEGQPLAILEGLACGKPFVCTDVGSCRELITGLDDGYGSAGYVVPVMNYLAIAEAIMKLVENPNLRSVMGTNGQKRVEALYAKSTFIDDYKKIYKKRGLRNGRSWDTTKKISER